MTRFHMVFAPSFSPVPEPLVVRVVLIYIHRVSLHVGDLVHPNVEVGFMPSLSKTGHGLLGQYGFFDLYRVTFDLPQGGIEPEEIREDTERKAPRR